MAVSKTVEKPLDRDGGVFERVDVHAVDRQQDADVTLEYPDDEPVLVKPDGKLVVTDVRVALSAGDRRSDGDLGEPSLFELDQLGFGVTSVGRRAVEVLPEIQDVER